MPTLDFELGNRIRALENRVYNLERVELPVAGSGGFAPWDATYLTLSASAGLTSERIFTPGTNLSAVDGGSGNPYTLNVNSAALTRVDDTNVTLTLGGSPATALLAATSLTLGWTGTLSPARGGTGVNNGTNTLTLSGNTAITGGGTIALGGFTLTVPATGTAVLGTGAANQVAYFNATNVITSSSNFGYDGSTVSIIGTLTAVGLSVTPSVTINAANSGAITISPTMISNAGGMRGITTSPTLSPSANVGQAFGWTANITLDNSSSNVTTRLSAIRAQFTLGASYSGVVTDGAIYLASAATISGGSFTGLTGYHVAQLGDASVTSVAGVMIANQTTSANRTNLVIGQTTYPSGVFSIYNSSANDNYFAGTLTIGTTTVSAQLTVNQGTLGNEVARWQSTATNDDPRCSIYQNRVATTNATVTTLHTVAIPANTTVQLTAYVVARRTGGASGTAEDGAGYVIYATLKNVAGVATIIGAVSAIYTAEDQAAWDATIDVDGGGNARVRVTGAAGNNVTWHLSRLEYEPVGS